MRVGIDATPLVGRRTGIGNYTFDLVQALLAGDSETTVSAWPITWRRSDAARLPDSNRIELVEKFAPARPMRALWERVAFPPLEAYVRCDVFHATNFLTPRSWRTPVVVTVHDLWFRERPDHVPPAQAALTRLLPNMLRRASAVITVSNHVRGELAEWLPDLRTPVHVVHNAPHPLDQVIPCRPDALRLWDGRPFALTLGTVNPRKNLAFALDAWRELAAQGVDLPLVVAGGAVEGVDPAAMLAERGLTPDEIVLLGWTEPSEVQWLLSHATVLVSTSLHEGFGLPLVEAMVAGVPVVAVDGGAVGEVTAGAASLVSVEAGPEVLADRVTRVIQSPALRQELIARGHAVGASYSWERVARETHEVYRSVMV